MGAAKDKHLPGCPFRYHSLCSAPKPSSSNPYLYPHAFLKLSGQLVGSSCLYTANQAKFSRSRRKYMHFLLLLLTKPFQTDQNARTTAESQTGYSHVLRSCDQNSSKSDRVNVFAFILVLHLFNSDISFFLGSPKSSKAPTLFLHFR